MQGVIVTRILRPVSASLFLKPTLLPARVGTIALPAETIAPPAGIPVLPSGTDPIQTRLDIEMEMRRTLNRLDLRRGIRRGAGRTRGRVLPVMGVCRCRLDIQGGQGRGLCLSWAGRRGETV